MHKERLKTHYPSRYYQFCSFCLDYSHFHPRSNAPALERKLNTLRVLPYPYSVQNVTIHLVTVERRAFRPQVTTRSIVTRRSGGAS